MHAQRPWFIGNECWLEDDRHVAIKCGQGYDVCLVQCEEDDQEQSDNVALIQAAPELLAACKAALEYHVPGTTATGEDVSEMIRAAIANSTNSEVEP